MYDIHCHILPGTDDGSPSFEESLKMAADARRNNTVGIICTPHVNSGSPTDTMKLHTLKKKFSLLLSDAGIDLKLYSGQEIMVGDNYREIPAMLKSHKLLTLAHSGYVLVEFPLDTDYSLIEERTSYIASRGFVPVVAHPERYQAAKDRVNIALLKKCGALIQSKRLVRAYRSGKRTLYSASRTCRLHRERRSFLDKALTRTEKRVRRRA